MARRRGGYSNLFGCYSFIAGVLFLLLIALIVVIFCYPLKKKTVTPPTPPPVVKPPVVTPPPTLPGPLIDNRLVTNEPKAAKMAVGDSFEFVMTSATYSGWLVFRLWSDGSNTPFVVSIRFPENVIILTSMVNNAFTQENIFPIDAFNKTGQNRVKIRSTATAFLVDINSTFLGSFTKLSTAPIVSVSFNSGAGAVANPVYMDMYKNGNIYFCKDCPTV